MVTLPGLKVTRRRTKHLKLSCQTFYYNITKLLRVPENKLQFNGGNTSTYSVTPYNNKYWLFLICLRKLYNIWKLIRYMKLMCYILIQYFSSKTIKLCVILIKFQKITCHFLYLSFIICLGKLQTGDIYGQTGTYP